ncbi:MAG: heavy-metal-associated domain-containing protein [Halobacteriota archaeon]
MATRTIRVDGMACDGCERRVQAALEGLEGVERASPDHERGRVEVHYDRASVSTSDLERAIADAGYDPRG